MLHMMMAIMSHFCDLHGYNKKTSTDVYCLPPVKPTETNVRYFSVFGYRFGYSAYRPMILAFL